MSDEVYISGIFQNFGLGDRLGTRKKYLGEDWEPAEDRIPPSPRHAQEAYTKCGQGYTIRPDQFPEGVAVWNEQAFAKRVKDIWWAGPFLTVNQKIADVISAFDLGSGGLVPVPLFKADLETPWPEKHYYINYGGPKNALVPEASEKVDFEYEIPTTGKKKYEIAPYMTDYDVALSRAALTGADIWIEESLDSKLFLSGALVDALVAADINVDLRLKKCRIVEDK
jgi:hypothetical protein